MNLRDVRESFAKDADDVEGLLAFGAYLFERSEVPAAPPTAPEIRAFRSLAASHLEAVSKVAVARIPKDEATRLALSQQTEGLRADLKSVHEAHGQDLDQIKNEIQRGSNIWKNVLINVVGGIVFGALVLLIQLLPPVFGRGAKTDDTSSVESCDGCDREEKSTATR